MLWLSFTAVHDNGADYFDVPHTYHNYIAAVGWYARHIPIACYSVDVLDGGYALFSPSSWTREFNATDCHGVKYHTQVIDVYCCTTFNLPPYTYFSSMEGICQAIEHRMRLVRSYEYKAVDNIHTAARFEREQCKKSIDMECDAIIRMVNEYRCRLKTIVSKRCAAVILEAHDCVERLEETTNTYIQHHSLIFLDQVEKMHNDEFEKYYRNKNRELEQILENDKK